MTQAQMLRFQLQQARQGSPQTEKEQATINKMRADASRKWALIVQAYNDTQLAAFTEILNVKKFKHRDIKYNKELGTLPSAQAYIGSRKNIAGWKVSNQDPDGPERQLPSFVTVNTDKGKLYSMGGYAPQLESKYDTFHENYLRNVPKDQRKTMKFFYFMKGKQDPYGKGKVPTNYQRLYLHQ
ncbi:MAG: hypothetical protein EZS28_048165, partial [Streblomastix strix]